MCVHFLQLYRQVLKDIQYVLITYVWQYEILKEFEKWSLVLLKKKQPTPSRSHFRLTLVKHRNICLNTTDSLVKYATFNKPSLGLLHSWVFPSDRPSKISANMSCPGASSGFKIWTNWHQDSSALIKPSCLIYLSDQTRLQNATVALSFTGENGNLHVFLTWVIGVSLSEDEWQKSQSLAASLVLWSFHWLFYQCNWSTALSVMDNFNVSVFQYICRHLSKQKKQKTQFQHPEHV